MRISRDQLIALGYEMRQERTSSGYSYWRWYWQNQHGGGWPTEAESWMEAATHQEALADRLRKAQ